MSGARLVVVRHGQTEWNVAGRIQGHGDSLLTALGIRQAEAMARRLAGESFDAILSSDLGRARHTAELLVPNRTANIRWHPGLRERAFGIAEGSTYTQIANEHPQMFSREQETDPDYAPPGGESRQQHLDRVRGVFHDIAAEHAGRTVLVVTHGGVLSCVYRWLHGIPAAAPHPIDIPNVGYNRLASVGGNWSVEVWGDVSHLAGLGVTIAE
ncbi:MAG: histidine phosphatase family protein [Burkholderiales bacterium]|nr:histidine phosphatase family protein [Burkholderiales bacterium]